MSQRKPHRQQEKLPFADLPLRPESEGPSDSSPAAPPAPPAPPSAEPPAQTSRPEPRPGEASLLFTEEDLRPVGPAASASSFQDDADEDAEGFALGETPALLQDRFLGALADLTLHLAVLGVAIVATQLMGVTIRWSDWPAFLGLGLAFSFLYTVVPLAFWGRTPGMVWVGHTSRSLSDEPLSFGQTVLRWIGALLTLALAGLPLLLALGGRSLSDRLSDSRTVQS